MQSSPPFCSLSRHRLAQGLLAVAALYAVLAVHPHGLGLALVRAIALRHGARLALPAAEKGFVLEFAWPKVAAAV